MWDCKILSIAVLITAAALQISLSAQTNLVVPQPSSAASENASPAPAELRQRYPRYQLCIGDVVEITFPLTSEFNQVVKVEPDGYVPLVGTSTIHVAGQSVPEMIESIRRAYRGILYNPEISVTLKEFQKPYFTVSGEVRRAGKYDLLSDTTATQALAIAGGLTSSAKHSQVLLFRRAETGAIEVKKLDVKHMLQFQSARLAEDVHLLPGDMLFVPKNNLSKFETFLPNTSTGVQMTPVH